MVCKGVFKAYHRPEYTIGSAVCRAAALAHAVGRAGRRCYILETVRQQGFQTVYSRHVATNNRVIIPKLRAGFLITGVELTDMVGLLVRLTYFFSPLRRKALDFRAGQLRPDDDLRRLFGL